ncbi:MAG: hypothetical protein LH614_13640 [Pyrinomonadaceae bacterium]|nr:hypothetical protein [Pyrinomonadaceae bacterium]
MGYSNYRQIKSVVKKFNLDMRLMSLFAEDLEKVEPSSWLLETLEMAKGTPITNEKSKSERIVSPILLEASKHYTDRISFFSGEALNVKPEDDLSGECDFFFALHPPKLYIDAPIISLAEAKDEDMDWGIAQCAAQMLGAKFYNEMEGKDIPFIYGCATDGIEWQFMKLENDIYYVDNKVFTDLREILGVWHHIIKLYL